MHRLSICLCVAVIAFILGLAAVSFRPTFRHEYAAASGNLLTPVVENRTSMIDVVEDGVTDDGFPTGRGTTTSSDGTRFSWQWIKYKSPQHANQELQKRLEQAVEIIRREPDLDGRGRQIGERVVATFAPYKRSSIVWAELIWTSGSNFGYVKSSSLQNILEYEDDHSR